MYCNTWHGSRIRTSEIHYIFSNNKPKNMPKNMPAEKTSYKTAKKKWKEHVSLNFKSTLKIQNMKFRQSFLNNLTSA